MKSYIDYIQISNLHQINKYFQSYYIIITSVVLNLNKNYIKFRY